MIAPCETPKLSGVSCLVSVQLIDFFFVFNCVKPEICLRMFCVMMVVLLSIHTLLISCYCSAYSIKVRKFAEINLEKCLSEEFCSCSPYTLYCFIFSRRPWGSVYRCRWGWCCRRHGRFTMGTEVPQGTLYHINCVFIL